MTTMVNIPQSKTDDDNYRYKMPQMKLSQESRLNGVKTNIKNLPDVARALRVPESAILKYFCVEVGANSEGTSIVKGQHLLSDLARHLDKFIMRYVCCPKCKLPEITHEVQKKNLIGICRSCGNTNKNMDVLHKAGKELHKTIPSYYQANPEFGSKGAAGVVAAATSAMVEEAGKPLRVKRGKGKKAAAAQEAADQAQKAEIEEAAQKARVEKLAATGGEVNRLDSADMLLTDENIVNACEELKAFVAEKEAEVGGPALCSEILKEVRQMQLQLNVTPEYKFYICICAIFGPHRNIAKHWDAYEAVFTSLANQDEEFGYKHLFQAVIQFFINRYPEMQKFAATLCKTLYDNSVIEDQLFIKWHGKKMKLDKNSKLHDHSAERAMRPLITDFITWLSSSDYDEEAAYGEEEEPVQEEDEEEKKEELNETEAQRNQRLLIEAQKKAQAEQLAAAQAVGALKKEQQAAAAAEREAAEEAENAAAALNLEAVKQTNVAKIEVEEEFDINDI